MRAKRDWKVFYTVQHVVLKLKNPFFFYCSVRCLLMWCSSVHYSRMPIKYLFTQDKFYFIFMMRDSQEEQFLLKWKVQSYCCLLVISWKLISWYFSSESVYTLFVGAVITRIMVYVFCCISVKLSEV